MSHKADEVIKDWIVGLSDDYIIQWANKGLLRRGRKLADKSPREAFDLSGPLTSSLEGHRQKIGGVGFQSIECSCPATGPCHHLVAALLIFRQILSQKTETAVSTAPCAGNNPKGSTPWLVLLPRTIAKAGRQSRPEQGGKTSFPSRAGGLQGGAKRSGGSDSRKDGAYGSNSHQRGPESLLVHLRRFPVRPSRAGNPGRLQGKRHFRNRGGRPGSLVVHAKNRPRSSRNLVEGPRDSRRGFDIEHVYRRRRGPCDLGPTGRPARNLFSVDENLPLARRRQDESGPRQARHPSLRPGENRRAPDRPEDQTHAPPFWELAGVHSRRYAMVRDLVLVGAGAETWESQRGYRGFTRYLFDPKRRLWYRHSQVKPVSFAEKTRWRPSEEFNRGRWSAGPVYRDIPGRKIRILLGWTSPDFRISARDGTRIEEVNNDVPEEVTSALPVYYDYLSLAEAYADFLSSSLFSEDPLMPAAVAWSRFEPQQFDPYRQVWSQSIFDSSGRKVNLLMETGPYAEKEAKALDTNLKAREQAIFGLLSQKAGILVLRPVSVALETNPFRWRHLTIEEKQHVGGR